MLLTISAITVRIGAAILHQVTTVLVPAAPLTARRFSTAKIASGPAIFAA